jgi:hypothetical protein
MVFTSARILTFSPVEKEQLLFVSVLLADCPANPVARNFKGTSNDSPSLGEKAWDLGLLR